MKDYALQVPEIATSRQAAWAIVAWNEVEFAVQWLITIRKIRFHDLYGVITRWSSRDLILDIEQAETMTGGFCLLLDYGDGLILQGNIGDLCPGQQVNPALT